MLRFFKRSSQPSSSQPSSSPPSSLSKEGILQICNLKKGINNNPTLPPTLPPSIIQIILDYSKSLDKDLKLREVEKKLEWFEEGIRNSEYTTGGTSYYWMARSTYMKENADLIAQLQLQLQY